QPVARWDGFPRLNTARTSQWQADKMVKDQILLEIPAATRPGRYPVLVGVYDPEHPEPTPDAPVEIATIRVW
ncbi:MAG TPA: hypothetical protein VER55_03100, partial [Ardenticatenaceae bacterium]|nr:hypothetical protein [Ardenticatenaceae bacterium]